jgi:hypothetical protein
MSTLTRRRARHGLAAMLLWPAAPLCAQAQPSATDAPPPVASEGAATQSRRSYVPADFARFAPRSALDMLENVPGFAIVAGDTQRRGLGEATSNVLINGQRFASKSTDIETELGRISAANVVRIEIADGATFNIAGLTGQVANIVTTSSGLSGTFAWRPQVRARRTPPRLTNGEISLNGTIGGTQFTFGLADDAQRNGNAGPERVFTPDGTPTDLRDEVIGVNIEQPRVTTTLKRNFGDGSILNLNAAAGLFHQDTAEVSLRSGPGLPDRDRRLDERTREYNYELGGDYEFGLGSGRLKLIGLYNFDHTPFRQTLIQTFADDRPDEGQRFVQTGDKTEAIGRGEYRWHAGRADWQLSLEGALNRLEVDNRLFELAANGDFVQVPLPDAAATVEEKRGEATLTYGRPLAPNLTLQLSAGGEYSQLTQSGAGGLARTFYRPKGFLNLAWRPHPGLDISARIERVVGQLNFFDFVASANVSAGTANAGNANLVPPQSWDAQVQLTQGLGRWGTATARLYGRLVSDVVDIIPIAGGGQSPGNLPGTARLYGLEWTSTFNFDPLGWHGAKLDMSLQFQETSLVDPLTFTRRPFGETLTSDIELNLRHDIPHTNLAYGVSFERYRESPTFRLDELWQYRDTPGSLGAYIEHKDVAGLTVRFSVDNLLDTNESFRRDFYDGLRTRPVILTEDRDRFYGPIFTLSVSGTI